MENRRSIYHEGHEDHEDGSSAALIWGYNKMSDIYFKCECGKSLAVDEAGIGRAVSCVDCGKPVVVPEPDLEFDCEGCGAALLAPLSISGDLIKCAVCGHRMTAQSVTQAACIHADVGRDCIPASSSSASRVACDAAPVMDSLMRRHMEFKVLRKPAQRGVWERVGPALPTWLLRAAAVFAVLVLARELLRDVFLVNSPESEQIVMTTMKEQNLEKEIDTDFGMTAQGEAIKPELIPDSKQEMAFFAAAVHPAMPEIEIRVRPETGTDLPEPLAVVDSVPPSSETVLSETADLAAKLTEAPSVESEELRLLREREAALPRASEERYTLLREIHFKEKPPALQELFLDAQRLESLVNYKTGPNQRKEFSDQLRKCLAQLEKYTRERQGRVLDAHFWGTSYLIIYGHAIRTARDYDEAERILRAGWSLTDEVEDDGRGTFARERLGLGLNMAQSWVDKKTLESSKLFDQLEAMALETGLECVRDIWGPQARSLHTRFMKYAENVPDEQRDEFMARQMQQLARHLLDDSTPKRNRAAALRGWIALLDKHGSLTDALPVIEEWAGRYPDEALEMNYYFARLWVELYGEGDWDKAERTMLLATREARNGGKLFDRNHYAEVINLFYELQFQPGYELQRRRTIRQKAEVEDGWQTASTKGRGR